MSSEVQQKVIFRKEIESTALKLTAQLEQITKEKQELAAEHQNNLVSTNTILTFVANYQRDKSRGKSFEG